MDREEMRFLAALECWKRGVSTEDAVTSANKLLMALDKGTRDYQDPATLEETIQARVQAALVAERVRTIRTLIVTPLRGVGAPLSLDANWSLFMPNPEQIRRVLLGDLRHEERVEVLRAL